MNHHLRPRYIRLRYIHLILCCILFSSLSFACSRRPTAPLEARTVYPRAGEGIALKGTQVQTGEIPQEQPQFSLRLALPDNYIVGQLIEHNLDEDDGWEQIVVFKRRDDQHDTIRIQIIDYHPLREGYVRAWEGETGANNVGSFSVEFADLTGDHRLEIICRGDDNGGQQTIDIFRQLPSAGLPALAYDKIAAFASPLSIEIAPVERGAEYESLAVNGAANPILIYDRVVETVDGESEDSEEASPREGLIKSTYIWNASIQRYVEEEREAIPNLVRQQEHLKDLLEGDVENFNQFVNGPWRNGETVIFFDSAEETIVFADSLTQVAYVWQRSRKTAVDGRPALRITMHNALLPNIVRNAFISVLSGSRLAVAIEDEDEIDGIYHKLESLAEVGSTRQDEIRVPASEIDGVFVSESGVEILFNAPFLTIREEGKELSGGYLLYELDLPVVEMNIINANGLPVESRTYIVEYAERSFNERLIRTLRLIPAEIYVDGIRPRGGAALNMEQIEDSDSRRDS